MEETARSQLGEKWENPLCRISALVALAEKFNEYNEKYKTKNVHYATPESLNDAAKMAYKFITNMINYEKASEKYILYRSGDELPVWETHTYKTICYSDGLFAGMLDDGGCALDISWRKRIQNANGKSYMQRLELDRDDLLKNNIAIFIPPMPPLAATVGMGEIHHPRSKITTTPLKQAEEKGTYIVDEEAMDIAGSNFTFKKHDLPEYYLNNAKPYTEFTTKRSIDSDAWKNEVINRSAKEDLEKIKYLCANTKFVNEDGSKYM